MALNTKYIFNITANESATADLGSSNSSHVLEYKRNIPDGTDSYEADLIWSDTRTLATTTEDIDIRGGITNRYGATITMAKLCLIRVHNRSDASTLTLGGDGTAPLGIFADSSDKIVIQPGGCFEWSSFQYPVTVSAGSSDVLQVQSSASATYDILVIGRSA